MKNQINAITNAEKSAIAAAKNETPFTADALAEELAPLVEDYFIGDFKVEGNNIMLTFLNGQSFNVTVSKAA